MDAIVDDDADAAAAATAAAAAAAVAAAPAIRAGACSKYLAVAVLEHFLA